MKNNNKEGVTVYAQDRGTGISGKGIELERASESGKALELESGKALESDCDNNYATL